MLIEILKLKKNTLDSSHHTVCGMTEKVKWIN